MTKTLISLAILTTFLVGQGAQAGEFSKALNGCKTYVSDFYSADQSPRVKFREAKSRGAGEAHMFFQVWPQTASGSGEKLVVKCIAKKSSGEVSALQVKNNTTKDWAVATK